MEYFLTFAELTPTPSWWVYVLALSTILGAIGTFWTQIKSSFEGIVGKNTEIELKEMDNTQELEMKKLGINEERINILEVKILKLEENEQALQKSQISLMKANVSLSTAVKFMLLALDQDNPVHKATIAEVKKILEDAKFE